MRQKDGQKAPINRFIEKDYSKKVVDHDFASIDRNGSKNKYESSYKGRKKRQVRSFQEFSTQKKTDPSLSFEKEKHKQGKTQSSNQKQKENKFQKAATSNLNQRRLSPEEDVVRKKEISSKDIIRKYKKAKSNKKEIDTIFDTQQEDSIDEKVAEIQYNKVKKETTKELKNLGQKYKKFRSRDNSVLTRTNNGNQSLKEYAQGMNQKKRPISKEKNQVFHNKSRYTLNKGRNTGTSKVVNKKDFQKKAYQKAYHYKNANYSGNLVGSAKNNQKAIQSVSTKAKKIASSIKSAIPIQAIISGGIALLVFAFVYLMIVVLMSALLSASDTTYLFTPAQATKIEQQFTKKELDYLDKIIAEAKPYTGDFNTTISYDPVGHDPHEILSLFNVLFLYEMEQKNQEKFKFNQKIVDSLIDKLIDARYSFEKETEKVTQTVKTKNEDGSYSEKEITTTYTRLISRTNSISNIIAGASYDVPANTKAFIEQVGEDAREIASKNDIYASVMIAQAILETGSGTSGLGKPPYFNLFGIKGSYNGESVTMYTKEDDGTGYQYTIAAKFRDYPSYKESMMDYATVMREKPRPGFYAPTYKSNTTSYRDATAYLTGTYATDTKYGSKLNKIIESNNLTQFDTPGTGSSSSSENTDKEYEKKVEKVLGGNVFALTEYEQELYKKTLEMRGMMGGYSSPVEDKDWGTKVKEPYGLSWKEDEQKRYTTDGLLLNIKSGTKVNTQITGKVTNVKEKNGKASVTIHSKDTVTFTYSNLESINVSKGQTVRRGQTIGLTSEKGLLINAIDSKLNPLNPEIIMYTETLKPVMYSANISSINAGSTPKGNNRLNNNMVGKSYDDVDVQMLFDVAKKYIGYPYVFGGSSPKTSFDCSGFIYWAYKEAGLKKWGRTTANELYFSHSAPISKEEARPGDLVFFKNTYNAGVPYTHVGIYAGDGVMLHAGDPIGFANIESNYWQKHEPTYGRLKQD